MLINAPKNNSSGLNSIGTYKNSATCETCKQDTLCRKYLGYLICKDCDKKIGQIINEGKTSKQALEILLKENNA